MMLCQFSHFFTTAILTLPIFENVMELPLNKGMTFIVHVLVKLFLADRNVDHKYNTN